MNTFAETARDAKIAAETAPSDALHNTSIAPKPEAKPGELPFIPADGYLVVRPIKPLKKTAGGLHLPDSSVPNPNSGIVMALGEFATRPDGATQPWKVQIGDIIHWRDIGAILLEHEGEKLITIGSEDIILRRKRDGE